MAVGLVAAGFQPVDLGLAEAPCVRLPSVIENQQQVVTFRGVVADVLVRSEQAPTGDAGTLLRDDAVERHLESLAAGVEVPSTFLGGSR